MIRLCGATSPALKQGYAKRVVGTVGAGSNFTIANSPKLNPSWQSLGRRTLEVRRNVEATPVLVSRLFVEFYVGLVVKPQTSN